MALSSRNRMGYNSVYKGGKDETARRVAPTAVPNLHEGDVVSIVVQARCPYCRNVLRIPADWIVQPMRCKFCHNLIQARAKAPAVAPVAAAAAPPVAVGVGAPPVAAPAATA